MIRVGAISVGAEVSIETEPGVFITSDMLRPEAVRVNLRFSGGQGVLAISRLMDVLETLREDLYAKVNA